MTLLSGLPLRFCVCATAMVFAFLFTRCNEPSSIGSELLDLAEVNVADSVGVYLWSEPRDSLISDQGIKSIVNGWLGTMNDPQLGLQHASIYTQVHLQGDAVNFRTVEGSALHFQKLELRLFVNKKTGASEQPQILDVRELAVDMDTASDYRLNQTLPTLGDNLTNDATFKVLLGASTDTIVAELSPELGQRLLDADADALANSAAFSQFFKGLRISTQLTNPLHYGAFYSIELGYPSSMLRLVYKEDVDGSIPLDSLPSNEYQFRFISASSARFNAFNRSATAGTLLAAVLDTASLAAQKYVVAQSSSMIRLRGRFSNFEYLDKTGLNRAYLILKVDSNYIDEELTFLPPPTLVFYNANQTGYAIPALYNATLGGYVFDVRAALQEMILNPTLTREFIIQPDPYLNNGSCGHRAIIGNHRNPGFKPEIRVAYTRIPN